VESIRKIKKPELCPFLEKRTVPVPFKNRDMKIQ
jgi:hypothetical protein